MLTTREFLRKNRRGSILKTIQEHYLRDDLWCGFPLCNFCKYELNSDITRLAEQPETDSTLFNFSHYIILDTNVVLDQIDLLEENALSNIIILHTVLQEVKHRSTPTYKRLKDITTNKNRNFYIFENENHIETYKPRNPKESPNDYNDRLIRIATSWYNCHVPNVKTILLTDDAKNKEKALEEKIPAETVENYISSLKTNGATLQEKLSKRNYVGEGDGKIIFSPHLTPTEIHKAIKNSEIHQGTFYISSYNCLEGNVNIDGFEKPVLVQGRLGLNRAIDGDTVAVKLLPEEEWSLPSDVILQDEEDADLEEDIIEKQEKDIVTKKRKTDKSKRIPTGVIVGIIKRKWRQYCGLLELSKLVGGNRHLFVPAERKIPKVRIETRQSEVLSRQKIVVAIDSWPRNSRYPLGHFVRALGAIGNKDTENEVLLLEHDIPHSKFSKKVLSFLPQMPWVITDEDVKKRKDLRHVNICSVDPPGCTDIDDALHCSALSDGNYEVGVHIADVTHFIRPDTALDDEAALRGTTVYLVDKRIDMVPELLSSNLCSLRENEERFAFSCIWTLNSDARIVNTRFHKSIIRSRRAFTYEEAQLKIDDDSQNDALATSLRDLNKLAKILKKRRLENGALVLSSPEVRFHVDSETNEPIEVQIKKICETNSMVEEFMLLANISVAEKIYQDFSECAVLRRHPQPPLSNFEPLIKAGLNHGFEIETSSGKQLATSLDNAIKSDNLYFNTMLRILATRCMLQAIYFSSGTIQYDDYTHYGLAVPIYTHFTSPIRRYADVMVHRLLAVAIGADISYPQMLDKRRTQATCNNLNYRNRMAQYAGRASVALNTHLYFRGKIVNEEGYILYVRKNALQCLIPKYGLEGTIYLEAPPGSSETVKYPKVYDEDRHTQRCGDIILKTFDPVTVRLSLNSNNIQHEKLVFEMIEPINLSNVENAGELKANAKGDLIKKRCEDELGNTNSSKKKKKKKSKM